jgi:hypothetical protein
VERKCSDAAVAVSLGTAVLIDNVLRGQSTKVPVSRPCQSRQFDFIALGVQNLRLSLFVAVSFSNWFNQNQNQKFKSMSE